MSVINITNESFEAEVMNSEKPVLLDFWASWCGPCKMIAPVLHEIADEHPEIKVCKVNVDDEMKLAMKFGIQSIPTLIVIKIGKATAQSVGFIPKAQILSMLED